MSPGMYPRALNTELKVLKSGARQYLRFSHRFKTPKFETSVSTDFFCNDGKLSALPKWQDFRNEESIVIA